MNKAIKNKYIFIDEGMRTNKQEKEEIVFNAYNELKEIAVKILGKDVKLNYTGLLTNPVAYLSDTFFELYLKANTPSHLSPNKVALMEQYADIKAPFINIPFKQFTDGLVNCGKDKPRITEKGLKTGLKASMWTREIPEKKRDMYDKYIKFMNLLNELVSIDLGSNSVHNLLHNKFHYAFKEELYSWEINKDKFL